MSFQTLTLKSIRAHPGVLKLRRPVVARRLEWQDWANPILEQPFEVKDGKLYVPDVPGVGLEWDEKAGSCRAPG